MYSYIDLYFNIIKGISGTAPFSSWSYSKFLCDINSILLIITMLFCTDLFSKHEELVQEITFFTPISKTKLWIIKSIAIFLSYMITSISCILLSLVFYKTTFDFTNFQNFLLPIFIILIPTFSVIFSLSFYLGNKKQILLYIFIPIVLLISLINFNITPFFDIFANSYIINTASNINIDMLNFSNFSLTIDFIASRFILLICSILVYMLTLRHLSK